MKKLLTITLIFLSFFSTNAQDAQKIYETEKAFLKMFEEKGYNQSYAEYMAPDGIIFRQTPINAREYFKSRPPSPAWKSWNPEFIDVSSNGALAYTIGNGMMRPKGKDDPTIFYDHYLSVWQRQPDGSYRITVDAGILHGKPDKIETEWKTPPNSAKVSNEKKISAADSSTVFFETAEKQGLEKAYKMFLAEDARILRDGKMPFIGKKAALSEIKKEKSSIKFKKRSIFTSAADLAYLTNSYTLLDKSGKEIEKGHFVQVWKLKDDKWQIVADIFMPVK